MTSPFSDRDQRIAFFQQWFSDTIPHSKALGLKIIAVRRGFGSMQLEWREELVGNPETGVSANDALMELMLMTDDLEGTLALLAGLFYTFYLIAVDRARRA
jgi:hypothetical protein